MGHLQASCLSRMETGFVMESAVGVGGVLLSTFSCLRIRVRGSRWCEALEIMMRWWHLGLSYGH